MDRPDARWAVGCFAAAALFFIFAVRQVPVPLFRGAEGPRLYRELRRLLEKIEDTPAPTSGDVDEIADEARNAIERYAPQEVRTFESDVRRGGDQGPEVCLEFIRQGIERVMRDSQSGGSP